MDRRRGEQPSLVTTVPPAPHRALRLSAPLAGLALCVVGLALRLHRLGVESLWYDETVSAHLAALRPAETVARTALDIHPPAYYLTLGAWTELAGASEFALAFFSCFFGVTLVALTYRLAYRAGGPGPAVLAASASALSAYAIWYSQEVRMYTLAGVLACLVTYATIRAADRPDAGSWWAAWGVATAGALYTLYYVLFLLPALSLYWLARALRAGSRPALTRWLGGHLLALLLYLPWVPVALRQALDPPVPPWRSPLSWFEALRQGASALALGEAAPATWWPLAALLVLAALVAPWARGTPIREVLLFTAAFVAPWLTIVLVSVFQPLFHPRYLFPYSPFFLASLAITVAGALRARRGRPLAALLAALFLVANPVSAGRAWSLPEFRPDDLRGAVARLAELWVPGDVVLANAGYTYTAIERYWPDGINWIGRMTAYDGTPAGTSPVILQGGSLGADPGLGWGHPESDFYATTLGDTVAGLERALEANRRLWVFRLYDTVTDPSGSLRAWLEASLVKTADLGFDGPSYGRLQAFVPPIGELPCTEPTAWGDQAVTCIETGVPQGRKVPVFVYAARPGGAAQTSEAVHYTLRLRHPSGETVVQTDGLLVVDAPNGPQTAAVLNPLALALTDGTPPGEYVVTLGLYTLPQGELHPLQPARGGQPLETPDGLVEVGRVTISP